MSVAAHRTKKDNAGSTLIHAAATTFGNINAGLSRERISSSIAPTFQNSLTRSQILTPL
jgi:hypothetical protein